MSPNRKYDFTGKVAIVTGSSSGIGRAIAIQLAQYGSSVTITGRDGGNLAKVAQEIENVGGKSLQLAGDLYSDQSLPAKLVTETIAKFGRLDYVVNSAGMATLNETFENENLLNQLDQLMGVIVRARLALTQAAVPHLETSKGAIVNISGAASAFPFMLLYSTALAACDMLTKGSASRLASKGIRVNSINPGPVRTAAGRAFGNANYYTEKEDFFKRTVPLKRIAEPEEIAHLASFLLSDEAINMTGSLVFSDGGNLVKSG